MMDAEYIKHTEIEEPKKKIKAVTIPVNLIRFAYLVWFIIGLIVGYLIK